MKNIVLIISLAAVSAMAVDIVPNPTTPGNLGASTNKFPAVYATNVIADSLVGALGGSNLVAASINSNKLDAPTLALIGAGGVSLADATNAAQGVLATGTASTASNLLFMPVFSPMNYGATGDGVADDTLSLSNCFAAANLATRGQIDLGGRSYFAPHPNVTATSLLLTNYDMVVRNGHIYTTNNAIPLIAFTNMAHRCTLSKVNLGGPNTNWTTASIGVMWYRGVGQYQQHPLLDRVKITNFWFGVYANLTVEARIQNCQITACGSNGVHAVNNDGFVISQTVLGNSTPDGGNLPDPGFGTESSKTNAFCFYFDGGIRQVVENCDMNASGSIGQVINTGGGTPHFEMRNNNFEEFWNSNRPYLLMSNVSYKIEHNKFSIKDGPVVGAIKAVNCASGKSYIGAQTATGVSPLVEIIGSSGILPTVEGYWSDGADNAIITYRATEGGAASYYGQTAIGPYTLIQRRVTSVDGQAQAGFLLGGNAASYGLSNSTSKRFTMAIPSYGNQTPVGFMNVNMFQDGNNVLVLGGNDNNTAMRYVDIACSTDGTYLSPLHMYRFSSNGMQFRFSGGNTANLNIETSGSMTASNHNFFAQTAPPGVAEFGAGIGSDGTNLIVVFRDSVGTLTTNKITVEAYP